LRKVRGAKPRRAPFLGAKRHQRNGLAGSSETASEGIFSLAVSKDLCRLPPPKNRLVAMGQRSGKKELFSFHLKAF
jgi:hypothetical protein